MRLLRPLRPLRSLRLLRFLITGKSSSTSLQCKKLLIFAAVEVMEASDVIMSVEVIEATEVLETTSVLEINKLMAKITLFWCFEKKIFWTEWWNFRWNSAIIQDWGRGGQGCYFQPNPRAIGQISACHEHIDLVLMTLKRTFDGLISVQNITFCV